MNDEISDWLANREDDTPAPMLADGEIVGDYAIVGFLGRGGSGEVYRAEHRLLKMPVALKVLYRGDEAGKARFAREAEILANNQCPGFPRFFSYGEADGRPYLATELLEERPLPSKEGEIAKFIQQVASAVGDLHKLGYVHRDIKPSNILWRIGGTHSVTSSVPVLIDLGLAKPLSDGHSPNLDTLSIDGGKPVGVGTPGYAAPEQFTGGEIGVSADIHALGVLANECFGGNPPKGWVQIIQRATSSIKAQRPENIAEFIKAINMRHRRRLPIFVPVVAAAVVVACIFVLQRRIELPPKEADPSPELANTAKSSPAQEASAKLGDIISYDAEYTRINALPADASADQIIEAAIADAKDAYARQVEKTEKAKSLPNIRVAHNLILLPAVHGSYANTFLRERGFNADMRKKYQPVIDGLWRQYRREWEAHRCGMPYFVVIEPKTERRPKSLLDDSSFEVERIH